MLHPGCDPEFSVQGWEGHDSKKVLLRSHDAARHGIRLEVCACCLLAPVLAHIHGSTMPCG